MMAAQTLQHLQMLIGQMQVIGNPIEQKKWANQVDTDLDQLKKEREELLAEAGPRSSIGWNVEYQNLVSDLGVLQANLQRWRPRTHWNVYWVDTKLVSSDLRGFDRLISRSLEEVSALQGSGAPILQ